MSAMATPLLQDNLRPPPSLQARVIGLGGALSALFVASGIAAILKPYLTASEIAMLLLVTVIWSSMTFGRIIGVFSAIGATLVYNYIFEPTLALDFDDTRDVVRIAVFLIVSLATGGMAAKLHDEKDLQRWHAELAESVSKSLDTLFSVSQALARVMRREELGALVGTDVAALLGQKVRLVEGETGDPEGAEHRVLLKTPRRLWGALLFTDAKQEPFEPSQRLLHEAVGEQVALALERIALMEEMAEARLIADGEKLRRALMNSISHDLKTPIGSIMGSASSLLTGEGLFDDRAREEQLMNIMQASERLNRYVRNLLDYTVIEAGALSPKCDWVDLAETVSTAIDASEHALQGKPVDLVIDSKLPLLWLDAALIEQVFVNLLENAAKYSPPGAGIEVRLRQEGTNVLASVFNPAAPGASGEPERLFEPYYRGDSSDRRKGAGLGLSICRAFMRAHGGDALAARDETRQGLSVQLIFPISHEAPTEEIIDD
jgi:two-component system sensor histidine kinase KdpD